MTNSTLEHIFEQVANGTLSVEEAIKKSLSGHVQTQNSVISAVQDTLCGLTLDTDREGRCGLGEVVFAPNKSDAQLISAIKHLAANAATLVTRVNEAQQALLVEHFPQGSLMPEARLFSLGKQLPQNSPATPWPQHGDAVVISAGGADRPVALEAFGALHFWGIEAAFIADVGVAGLHRLSPHVPALQKAKIIIAVAGMEGALPGIVAGFVRCPVLAVPTSVGYGVGAKGAAALSSMLCSCVPGIAVCNIDNGFGAAAFAAKMLLP